MRKIEFWYSIGSTYTYLSTQRLAQIETENEVVFEWCPFSVRSRMIEMENVPFMAEKKRDKIDYMWRDVQRRACLLYTSPSPRDKRQSRMPSSA